ncbi:MAG: Lrp/AsnC family transcriptional regulator [Euryarchaeota archaeon]|nr:Lrp/AsnC family transcriptional regulator [Euryarchaeota archaeon]MDE1836009.1 Lrp/AsnC family transcriptional regulator [Euryarchaeota archaeon]MDE1881604.1 Lrp/AsnC family transcriptional regulator [Euryarchaeota archaeon]MDE2045999.1 Lrp/AsnC family transcriptional regulator [Thermoplasmata archaeon]
MDQLDGAILREMFRGRHLWVGGVDPRQSAAELAERLGVTRTTIWSRLKAWRTCGFLEGFDVVPNPDLFGLRFGAGSLRVDDPVRKAAILEDLGQVRGIVGAQDTLGPWMVVLTACANGEEFQRCSGLLRGLSGVVEAIPLVTFACPVSQGRPTPMDWRILLELRRSSTQSLTEAADQLRLSSRTVLRRYTSMVRRNLIWYIPLLDYTKYGGVAMTRFNIYLHPTSDTGAVLERVRRQWPTHVDLADRSEFAHEAAQKVKHLVLFLQIPSAAGAEDVQKELLGWPDVAEVEVLFPRRTYRYPSTLSDMIEKRLAE